MNITSRKRQVVEKAVRQFLDDMTPEFAKEYPTKAVRVGYILKANHYFAKEKLQMQDVIDLVSYYYDEHE
ncbi:hypothetical protein IGI39_004909 [Enterococcus sp. AZ135]|uniref:hypothetical protein n=1 Tax=unclassified Enterococcus TaxID=2608891 RepID=UPI003F206AC5